MAAAAALIVPLTAVLALDILPSGFSAEVGDVAPADVRAPRTVEFTSRIETEQAREAARASVEFQYDYDFEKGQLAAAQQALAFQRAVAPVDAAFGAVLDEDARRAALAAALPSLSQEARTTLQGLERSGWEALRADMQRVLEEAQRQEVRDTVLPAARAALPRRLDPAFPAAQRALAGEILSPLLVANSTYDPEATEALREQRANEVQPVTYTIKQDELIVQEGRRLQPIDVEKLSFLGLLDRAPDPLRFTGWLLLSALAVGLLLAWLWRFRPTFWHRDNTIVLVALLLLFSTIALRVTADRSILPFVVPVAAVGLLVAVLLDSSAALVVLGIVSVLAGVVANSIELAVYVFLGGFAGVVAVRRGERFANFVQAAAAMAVVDLAVVTTFTLLGYHDLRGGIELWAASIASAAASALAAVGSFAVLGNLFGITTSFQLLELANPSQPLLRRLLMETSGTYHHSLMVGNLAERAAEAIGADPLLTRVAAYYHDIGKLANPLAYIENQAGAENVHDELTPEQSAALLKAHVSSGIDLAYEYRLPKPIIAFIPQHHGTALMSYFYAKAKEEAASGSRAATDSEAEGGEALVNEARFRHVGPKPQSREAAILMLADGVEASVRSLTSHEEPAIRAMVERIIRERLEDGQFDECDLTLRDLDRIREAFVAQLLGMYHRRIQYPQNKIVELESRRAAGQGR